MFDLAVIGGGPGGYVAAIRGAQKGLKTVLVEKDTLGGTCLNRGCIPTKSLIYDSKVFYTARNASILKGTENLSIDPKKLIDRKRKVVEKLLSGLNQIILNHGIEIRSGTGELISPHKIQIVQPDRPVQMADARNIILATGSRPSVPSFIHVDGSYIQTTDEALDSKVIPKEIVIIGGGVIGIEMATIYLNLGSKVTIIELLPEILATEDKEIRQAMHRLLLKNGASVHLKRNVKNVTVKNGISEVTFEDDAGTVRALKVDKVLVATGRSPVLDGIDCNQLGIEMNGPFVRVDEHNQTNLPGVYAIGDLTGGMMLAHKASAEAEVAVGHISGVRKQIKPEQIPRCIWGLTEVSAIGLTEHEARSSGRKSKVGLFSFAESSAAQAIGNTRGFVKIIGDADTGEILGVHIMGERATDLISEAATVMRMEGAVEDLYEAIKPHPTLSETVMEAAMDWNRIAIHSPKR